VRRRELGAAPDFDSMLGRKGDAKVRFGHHEKVDPALEPKPERKRVMKVTVELKVNGKTEKVSTETERSLLEALREDLGLTGTKYGCGEAQCRACTVLVDCRPVTSCVFPASQAEGKEIVTIEGLAPDGRLHFVQEAFLQEDAMQCGYCVPGMILTAAALLERNSNPSREQIVEGMNGNLCRCCGYPRIVQAVARAAEMKASNRGSA
jgi:aerobic-type carbon monoxide dehydrogenase small subunit (CoxS/CutS family)